MVLGIFTPKTKNHQMKKIILFFLTSLITFSTFAQNLPQGIAYQAVAIKEGPYSVAGENPQAIYWSNKDIKVRFTILDQYPNPMDTYQEFHPVTTDDYGVFNLIIGQGSVLSGDFETIPWELGTAHLRVEIDFDNDDSYTITSFERFWSVPYAFVTKKDESTNNDSAIQALNDKINALRANDLDTVIGNEIQTLAIKGDSLSISDGNTVKIDFPANLDNDPVNEIQTISISNDTVSLSSGGGSVILPKNWTLKDSTITNNSKFVHVGNSTTDSSAILNVTSNSAGILIPRMNSNQRTGINSPANGLLVFDIQTKSFWYYSGQWIELASSNTSSSKSTNSETLIFTVNGF